MTAQFKNATELARFIQTALPCSKDTGKTKDLRKIKSDPKAKGKGVLIWWGNANISEVTELRVSVHLGVSSDSYDRDIALACEALLKKAYALQHGEVKQETTPVDCKDPAVLEVIS